MNNPLITQELVSLDVDFGSSTNDVIKRLAKSIADCGRATDAHALAHDAIARETKAGTGVNGQVAIPHCRSAAVIEPTLAFARLTRPVDFGGPDGDADLVFLIAAPDGGGKEHLKILSKLARALVRGEFINQLRGARTDDEIVQAVLSVTNAKKSSAKKAPSTSTSNVQPAVRTIIAVTACPTGIAHTYMAADSLQQAADKRDDVTLFVETQGSSGGEQLDPAVIDSADAVIFAVDVAVRDKERFAGKPLIQSPVKRGINEPDALLDEAITASSDPNAQRVPGDSATTGDTEGSSSSGGESWPKRIQQAVMTGVSYMVPFVAAGGLLLALGFLIGGYDVANGWQAISTGYSLTNLPGHEVLVDGEAVSFDRSGFALYCGAVMFAIGQAAMGFVVAALSGYTAFSLAGRPGIAPGFVGGAISVMLGAGFIGGLITGILAGLVAYWIGNWQVPAWLRSLMPVVIIPLLASLIVGLTMFLLLGRPLEAIMTGLTDWLSSMSGSSAILLGLIIGLMMCFDLGGPVNKAAYLFGTAGLSAGTEASFQIMAAVMLSGMVPPIAMSIATFIRKQLFTPAEQENGKSAWLLGLSFVSEGAIPFAAADPLRVIPSMMAGGAVTGAVSMAFGVGSRAPHGGIFVLFAINPWWGALIALIAGIATSTIVVVALKQFWPNRAVEQAAHENEAKNAAKNSTESTAVTA
ncbi:PTS fructose transporter subunit IIABC [Corynebacterium cystitidis]|uniref:PTS system, fructose-specific IIC component n=1 Tax=Corynebacterium cystitidis DSM 20524 TaxID=1121357 RepID=A0A1H9P6S6_9CORY|nr:fructose-specific PTS transporter subunit EIIC [Corynebacterium cystitidis]WJY82600.1 PTS system fructose-specific EIIABC component [Corynebacterium cystitidis DSM 20524]SER43936.1 PTS system, fructose-specific IIC component [Corynebacterium cystitidis DSM 20524]SNV72936.1 sugar specific PTS system, fructose/mannitol-specific transport protein [Corynebacterium cystitidis]